jgi:tripartite-type tricarboxylate transporter receptor subunit TctC
MIASGIARKLFDRRSAPPTGIADPIAGGSSAIASIGGALLILFIFLTAPVSATGVEDFYRGRQVDVLVGFSAGGGFDLYARLLARHLGDYMPGHPRVVVQDMPGSGSLTAALNILNVAPKDGTIIGTFVGQVPLLPILSDAKFDGSRFNWIGSVTSDNYVCVASARSQVKSWADMLTKTFVAGGNGPDSGLDIQANLLKNVLGAKIRLVTGYPGTNDVKAAMLRGEVDGECGLSYSTLQTGYAQELARKEIVVLVQVSLTRNPQLPDVPVAGDFATTPQQKEILRLLMAPNAIARPFAAPPGIPADRLEALRTAFDRTVTDADFLAEAHQQNLDVHPMRGTEIAKMIEDLYQTPKAIVEAAKGAVAEPR